jgi:hypothetical protein
MRETKDVDSMTVEELRIEIAERLGYVWAGVSDISTPFLLTPEFIAGHDWWNKHWHQRERPEKTGPDTFLHCPDWPSNIASADTLLDSLDEKGLSYTMTNKARGFQVVVSRGMAGSVWFIGQGETRPEAISRAWLKTREAP